MSAKRMSTAPCPDCGREWPHSNDLHESPRTPTPLDEAWEALEAEIHGMKDDYIPDAIARHRPLIEAEAMPAPPSPSAGELWFAASESGARRILLLLSTDAEHGLARAAITSTEAEVATDASLVFSAQEVGTSFAVVVQTDLVMPVWLRQLGPYVGRLPIPVELIQQAAESRDFAAELEARRGMPLHGPHDTRVAVRDQELDELWEIAGECVAEIEAWDAAPDPAPLDVDEVERTLLTILPQSALDAIRSLHTAAQAFVGEYQP